MASKIGGRLIHGIDLYSGKYGMLKIHHQASFTQIIFNPLPPSCSFHVGILFIFAALGIRS